MERFLKIHNNLQVQILVLQQLLDQIVIQILDRRHQLLLLRVQDNKVSRPTLLKANTYHNCLLLSMSKDLEKGINLVLLPTF